jgi:hypothetical protein
MLNYMIFTLQANFQKSSSSEYGTTLSKEKKEKKKSWEYTNQADLSNIISKWACQMICKLMTLFLNDI